MSYQLVWFKRDLRLEDHTALTEAAKLGPVRCIYVIELTLWQQPDVALQHFEFIRECLQDLDAQLHLLGGTLEIHEGEITEVLTKIWQANPFHCLHSHQETGDGFTYFRDKEVKKWCQSHDIHWGEYPQFRVIRELKNRNAWQANWQKHMEAHLCVIASIQFWEAPPTPNPSVHYLTPSTMQAPAHLKHNPPLRQHGVRSLALKTLNSFLQQRSMGYRGGISSPLSAPDACSRLSVYLTYRCLSIREVVQATNEELLQTPPQASRKNIRSICFHESLILALPFHSKAGKRT